MWGTSEYFMSERVWIKKAGIEEYKVQEGGINTVWEGGIEKWIKKDKYESFTEFVRRVRGVDNCEEFSITRVRERV